MKSPARNNMKSPIEQEIEWCKSHRGESGRGEQFEEGFIAGLKQALKFQQSAKTTQDAETKNLLVYKSCKNEECGNLLHLFTDSKYRCMNETCDLYNEVQE